MNNLPRQVEQESERDAEVRGHSVTRTVLVALLLSAAFYVTAELSLAFAFPPDHVGILWLPNTLVLTALLLSRTRVWWVYLLAILPAELAAELPLGVPLWMSLGFVASNWIELLVAATLLRRILGSAPAFASLRGSLTFILVAGAIAPAVSSAVAALLPLTGVSDWGYIPTFRMLFLSAALAYLTVTPALLMWITGGGAWLRLTSPARLIEAVALGAGVTVVGFIAFGQETGQGSAIPLLIYSPLPLLLWAGVRFGSLGGTSSLLLITLVAVWNAVEGRGPFSSRSPVENVVSLQYFLFVIAVTLLLLAALIEERTRVLLAHRESENRYRLLVESQQDLVVKLDRNSRLLYASPTYCEASGKSEKALIGKRIAHLLEDSEQADVEASLASLARPPHATDYLTRTLTQDGWRWFSWSARAVTDERGDVDFVISVGRDITEQKQAEKELKQAHQRLSFHIDNSPLAYIEWDNDFRVRVWSDGARKIFGWTQEQVEGKNFTEWPFVHPDDAGQVDATAGSLTSSQAQHNISVNRNLRKDGSVAYCAWYNSALLDSSGALISLFSQVQDISDLRRAEDALRFTQFAVDRVADAAFWMGPDASFIYVNEAACRSLGYTREELLKLTVHDIDPGFPREVWPDHWQEVRQRRFFTIESQHRARDGRVFPVEITVNYLDFEGKEYNCAFVKDISERKKMQAQVQKVQKLESLGVLAGGIAHDFNNLLTGVLGNADLALTELPPGSQYRHYIESIDKAAQRATELARQMLAYSGRGKFVIECIDLSSVVSDMGQLLESSVTRNAELTYVLDEELPLIEADITQVRQIVMNLITNAAEAIGDREAKIRVTTGSRHCDSTYFSNTYLNERHSEGRYVFLEVSDRGCGMDAETLEKIFDPFFTTKFTGRGLGLAALLGIVRGHQGAVKVDSTPGKGTTFTVLFPASDAVAKAPRPVEAQTSQIPGGTVLLVDDEDTVVEVGRKMLVRLGYQVITATNGQEAVAIFEMQSNEIDLVVLDLTMPRMDGEEAFRQLTLIDASVPILLASGYSELEIEERFAGKKLAGIIQKPFRLRTLSEKIAGILDR